MRRRRFLEASAAGVVAMSWPGFSRQAFGASPDPSCPKDPTADNSTSSCEEVLAANSRAHDAGQPLLVVVIPEDDRKRYLRGELLGGLINWGDDSALAALGLCEVVCASMTHARVLPPLADFVGAEPLAFLVEVSGTPTPYRLIPEPDVAVLGDPSFDRALVALANALRAGIGAAPAHAVRLRSPADVVELAKRARARLKEQRIPGSRWAKDTGCGVAVEQLPSDEDWPSAGLMMACGMGHVPAKATRMLHFYVERRKT